MPETMTLREMVLLVDDHDVTRRAIAVLLRSSGYDVRTAACGHAALHFLGLFRPDAIVLDLALPDMNGIDLLQCLRKDPFLARTPVLIFSGDPDYLTAAQKADAQGCLAKGSVSWQTLVEQLARVANTKSPKPWSVLLRASKNT